ncbi:Nucleotide exchange factor SIL1 [Daldinia childiae]|uniref:Nucleotide exchange factor SIL1 n=1 Tax=Daldinia childiae TaxID=326645 RepID=UPI0014470A10|nr:Nucleotide exchange factor SIL1 [Daldinia childiae]KAF3064586.1 Nucleotide exchange factor SIL1 [Daldinia childiae]
MKHSYAHNIMKRLAIATLVASSALSFTHASSPPSESPSAETELICHTDNPAECYPKVFSATEDFQPVHDDQDLPPGLHVQLDVQTGQKQAKLYNPAEENPAALEGLPVDRSVVVVDPETPQDDDDDDDNDQPRIPPGAPAYEPVGVVKAPKEKNEGFTSALETVKKSSSSGTTVNPDDLDKALEDLEDLSHGIYYGLQIASDPAVLHALFCLLAARDPAQAQRPLSQRTDFLASAILASSVRNNKPALRAVEQAWDSLLEKNCPSNASPASLRSELFSALQPTATAGSPDESAEAYAARLSLAVLDGLLKSPLVAAQFLAHGGMRHFLEILQRTDPVWDARKAKVARIVSDVFLDEEVGAVLGVWPTSASVTEASVCEAGGPDSLEEGCWEYHLEVISQGPDAPGWSQPLLDLLRRRRGEKPGAQRRRDEL